MDFTEIKSKTEQELQDLLAGKQAELQALRMQSHSRQLKQVHKISAARKLIAQIKTVLPPGAPGANSASVSN